MLYKKIDGKQSTKTNLKLYFQLIINKVKSRAKIKVNFLLIGLKKISSGNFLQFQHLSY